MFKCLCLDLSNLSNLNPFSAHSYPIFTKLKLWLWKWYPVRFSFFYQPTLLHQHFIKNQNIFWKSIFHFHEMISMFAKVKNFGSLWSPLDRIHFCKHNFHFYESWRRLILLFALLILPYEIYVSKMDSSQYWSWKKWIPFCHFEILTV